MVPANEPFESVTTNVSVMVFVLVTHDSLSPVCLVTVLGFKGLFLVVLEPRSPACLVTVLGSGVLLLVVEPRSLV